ncbi:class I SAM-dependent methyltransferase [Collinsella sp. AGMB00827]|uniref:Class I SAM-dependent methyltransferase n=1 Tax=Collinsella ureilytica TaxID=2869515 RepID=A0ABS7MKT4_9ACTN|nr:class I SAM-dependent methyltransferase [Collinsella urealyticum]MBY4797710.1 class I SAM-dependent methyltransferase [Collinsella urealyticum]
MSSENSSQNGSAIQLSSDRAPATRTAATNEEADLMIFPPTSPLTNSEKPSEHLATVELGNGKKIPVIIPESEQFANRLRKNARVRRRWAKRTGVSCYRVYDADLPDYAAAIDLYEGSPETPGRWLSIAEYAPPATVDKDLARARMADILNLAPAILDVEPNCTFDRTRRRARGGSQYAQKRKAPEAMPDTGHALIQEGGLTFEIDLASYLDTGIFLDTRLVRKLIRSRAQKRHARYFLNLFAYTGTASCYAADAGVQETVTVDLSNTYLDWAERNMELNGFCGPDHHFVRDDCLAWMDDQLKGTNRWDLIFCDPPTFSNSSKMGVRTWDVQRDHVGLLTRIVGLLTEDGEAIFCCNLRRFKPDLEALEAAGVELTEITDQTIPEDFSRNARIHHCYLVRHAQS